MKITSDLFDAFLKCPTKCYLRSTGQNAAGNAYAEWVREQKDAYRKEAVQRLVAVAGDEIAVTPPDAANLKTATWRLAVDMPFETETMASRLHAVERVPSEGRGRPAQFIPVRFVFFNKLTRDDRLLVAFDALVLSEVLGREVSAGKIIHGDDHAALKVKVASLLGPARKLTGKMSALLAGGSPPDLVLNRHCGECEFRDGCRQKALEKDDLSLLGGMSAKERQKIRSKGIFTVTQLSYTFRPRRRPKRQRDKREKYHHSLKALAVREKKIHIVGSPELKIDGTPVYLDVEGLPDRDFYYLIGMRIGNGESAVQHSLWADTIADEERIWREFLGILETVENPLLIHYGSFETTFLKCMRELHGGPVEASASYKAIGSTVNLLSLIYAQIYFPTLSNGLKDIAAWHGFNWSESEPSGLKTIMWRRGWELEKSSESRSRLTVYNAQDCQALAIVTQSARGFLTSVESPVQRDGLALSVVHTELLPRETMWPQFSSPISAFEQINKVARWDYQRDRVYVRSSKRIKKIARRRHAPRQKQPHVSNVIIHPKPECCPDCRQRTFQHVQAAKRVLHDICIGRWSLRRRVVEHRYHVYWCLNCRARFGVPDAFWPRSKVGRNLVALVLYYAIELYIPLRIVRASLNRLFGLELTQSMVHNIKVRAANYYTKTRDTILGKLVAGELLHVDETRVSVRGKTGWVWVFTNLHEVAFVYADTREAELIQNLLGDFRGVLVSDFYTAYDSVDCRQQRCLIHLMRDLNDEVLDHPYDEELIAIVTAFAQLLKPMVDTVDQRGLKRHFLGKHRPFVDRFYRRLDKRDYKSEAANRCKQRFDKNRDKLFTFLEYDGVPWNNNNAEHAIKAFAALRSVVEGTWTPKAVEEYLVILSICETCKYSGVDFLDFLRSGEKDIYAFAENRHGRTRQTQSNEPTTLSAGEGTQK